ncbi:sialidase family protein [Ohtaekwangia sp.]|uniref:sialidase family protein n=1 Tax=Ohtaekwangia sp. TaxID=2066019 RepID=UPI002FDCA195
MNKPTAAFIFCLLYTQAAAQVKNITIGVIEGLNARASIAASQRDNKIQAAAIGNIVYFSADGGNTWQKSSITFKEGSNAILASDSKGGVYYLLQATEGGVNRIWCYTSDDGGQHWDEGNAINAASAKDQINPNVTFDDKNNLYVTYTQFDKYTSADPNCLSTIQLVQSSNGRKWGEPRELSQTPGNCNDDQNTALGPMAAISPDGKEYCIWANQSKIFLDRSFNGKQWLTNDIAIARLSERCKGEQGANRCFTAPVFLIDKNKKGSHGSLYMTWSDWLQDDRDVWFLRSHNFGDNWSTLQKVNEDVQGIHQYNPWMAVDHTTGYIYILYFAQNKEDGIDVYLAHSIDGGNTFKNTKISESSFKTNNPTAASCYISAHKGLITAAWTRYDSDKGTLLTATLKQEELIPAGSAKPVSKR